MMSVKVLLMFGGTAGAIAAVIETAAAATTGNGITGNPTLDGLIGWGGGAAALVTLYKYKVDRIEKVIDTKADRETVERGFERMERQLESIESFLRQR
jgi:hypothetical protein